MKNSLIILCFILSSVNLSNAQNIDQCKMTELITGGGRNFQITGNDSNAFADSLFSHFPKMKRKGYIWKFKKITIPGIEEPLTLQVHQGLSRTFNNSNCDTSKCNKGSYFNTFTSEKYKQIRISQNKVTEQPALLIYVKRGRNYGLKTKEEAEIVRTYLLTICQG